MPPWRIQHEPHTCSERSLRILLWNASGVQRHQQQQNTMRWTYIYYNHSGRWPYKTTAIRYMSPQLRRICAEGRDYTIYCAVHLHRNILQRLHWPLTAMFPSGPLQHNEVLHLYRWYTHTRPATAGQMKWNESEMTMKMKWKLLNQDAKRGTQKKREGANTNTNTWPGAGNRWKGKGKEKRRPTDTKQDHRRRGKTEAPKPTYHSET